MKGEGIMVTRNDFIKRLAENMESNQKGAKICLDSVLNTLAECLEEGETVKFTGFGAFHVVMVNAMERSNPSTGEKVHVPAHKKVIFRASGALKDLVK